MVHFTPMHTNPHPAAITMNGEPENNNASDSDSSGIAEVLGGTFWRISQPYINPFLTVGNTFLPRGEDDHHDVTNRL